MDRTERFCKIERLIAERWVMTRDELLAELEACLAKALQTMQTSQR